MRVDLERLGVGERRLITGFTENIID